MLTFAFSRSLLFATIVNAQIPCAGQYTTFTVDSSILPSGSALDALNNLLQDVASNVGGDIPVVGTLVSSIVDLVWPTKSEQPEFLYDNYACQVLSSISSAVYQENMKLLTGALTPIRTELQDYVTQVSEGLDASSNLCSAISRLAGIQGQFQAFLSDSSANVTQVAPTVLSVGFVHMATLREQYEQAYACSSDNTGFYDSTWLTNMEAVYAGYMALFESMISNYKANRGSSILAQTDSPSKHFYTVTDTLSGVTSKGGGNEYFATSDPISSWDMSSDAQTDYGSGTKTAMVNEAFNQFVVSLLPSLELWKLLPRTGKPELPEWARTTVFQSGPYSVDPNLQTTQGSSTTVLRDGLCGISEQPVSNYEWNWDPVLPATYATGFKAVGGAEQPTFVSQIVYSNNSTGAWTPGVAAPASAPSANLPASGKISQLGFLLYYSYTVLNVAQLQTSPIQSNSFKLFSGELSVAASPHFTMVAYGQAGGIPALFNPDSSKSGIAIEPTQSGLSGKFVLTETIPALRPTVPEPVNTILPWSWTSNAWVDTLATSAVSEQYVNIQRVRGAVFSNGHFENIPETTRSLFDASALQTTLKNIQFRAQLVYLNLTLYLDQSTRMTDQRRVAVLESAISTCESIRLSLADDFQNVAFMLPLASLHVSALAETAYLGGLLSDRVLAAFKQDAVTAIGFYHSWVSLATSDWVAWRLPQISSTSTVAIDQLTGTSRTSSNVDIVTGTVTAMQNEASTFYVSYVQSIFRLHLYVEGLTGVKNIYSGWLSTFSMQLGPYASEDGKLVGQIALNCDIPAPVAFLQGINQPTTDPSEFDSILLSLQVVFNNSFAGVTIAPLENDQTRVYALANQECVRSLQLQVGQGEIGMLTASYGDSTSRTFGRAVQSGATFNATLGPANGFCLRGFCQAASLSGGIADIISTLWSPFGGFDTSNASDSYLLEEQSVRNLCQPLFGARCNPSTNPCCQTNSRCARHAASLTCGLESNLVQDEYRCVTNRPNTGILQLMASANANVFLAVEGSNIVCAADPASSFELTVQNIGSQSISPLSVSVSISPSPAQILFSAFEGCTVLNASSFTCLLGELPSGRVAYRPFDLAFSAASSDTVFSFSVEMEYLTSLSSVQRASMANVYTTTQISDSACTAVNMQWSDQEWCLGKYQSFDLIIASSSFSGPWTIVIELERSNSIGGLVGPTTEGCLQTDSFSATCSGSGPIPTELSVSAKPGLKGARLTASLQAGSQTDLQSSRLASPLCPFVDSVPPPVPPVSNPLDVVPLNITSSLGSLGLQYASSTMCVGSNQTITFTFKWNQPTNGGWTTELYTQYGLLRRVTSYSDPVPLSDCQIIPPGLFVDCFYYTGSSKEVSIDKTYQGTLTAVAPGPAVIIAATLDTTGQYSLQSVGVIQIVGC